MSGESQLSAEDIGITLAPSLITHSTPLITETHLDSSLTDVLPVHQPHGALTRAQTYRESRSYDTTFIGTRMSCIL